MYPKATLTLLTRERGKYKLIIQSKRPDDGSLTDHTFILDTVHLRELLLDSVCALASDAKLAHSLNSSGPTASIGASDARQAQATNSTGTATAQAGHQDD